MLKPRLNHKVELYVPSADGAGNALDAALIAASLETAQDALTLECGGTTTYPAVGTYQNKAGAIVREHVQIVSAFCSGDTLERVAFIARHIAGQLAATMSQECIALEISGALEFVESSASLGSALEVAA